MHKSINDIKKSFNHNETYNIIYSKNTPKHYAQKRVLDIVLTYLKKNKPKTLLDVGAAEGFHLIKFNELNIPCQGVDFSEAMVKRANMPNLDVGDATNLRFKDNSFEGVVCLETLQYIPKLKIAISECFRVANKFVIFSFPLNLNIKKSKLLANAFDETSTHAYKTWGQQGFKLVKRKGVLVHVFPFQWTLSHNLTIMHPLMKIIDKLFGETNAYFNKGTHIVLFFEKE